MNPDARILLASGLGDDEQVKSLLAQGAAGFLAKPFDRDTMAAQVTQALQA